jgi:phosphate transport system permease protein
MRGGMRSGNYGDAIASRVFGFTALLVAALSLWIIAFVLREAWPFLSINNLFALFSVGPWHPLERQFNAQAMIVASVLVCGGALVIAAPLGIAIALYTQFVAGPKTRTFFRGVLAMLAGIPSVVFGLWGLTTLVPLIAIINPPGASMLAAILILALMVLPTIAVSAESALGAVPNDWLKAGAALGLSTEAIALKVALPAGWHGIRSGIILAAMRALGETMAVLMVAGNVVQLPSSIFDSVRVLTANIALEMAYATGQHRSSLFATGLLLTLIVFILAWLSNRSSASYKFTHA